MKPAAFEYARPRTVEEAVRLLGSAPGAKVLAGGQTLGPMLNLRLAQPAVLVDITRIAELAAVSEDARSVTFGAIVTHAAIEDGRVLDPAGGFLGRVAAGIAYRAVRNRGTIGGSLAHADPAADWLSALTGLAAEIEVAGPHARRRLLLADFVRGAMESALEADELVTAIAVPKFSPAARFGYHKICRKTGEFAEAIGVAVHDPERGAVRLVASSARGRPIVIDAAKAGIAMGRGTQPTDAAVREAFMQAGGSGDAYDTNIHVAALQRAIAQVNGP